MKLEIDTPVFDVTRYGRPCIARIDFFKSCGQLVPGHWSGAPGLPGKLCVIAEPGDVIVKTQMDLIEARVASDYGFVEPDGTVSWGLTQAQAYEKWDAVEKGETKLPEPNPLEPYTVQQLVDELKRRGFQWAVIDK